MFVSRRNFEFPMPAKLAIPQATYWRMMELSAECGWFMATVRATVEGQDLRRTIFLAWDSDVRFLLDGMPEARLESLQYMDPPSEAGGAWSNQRITQIWSYSCPDTDAIELIFTSEDGEDLSGWPVQVMTEPVRERTLLVQL